MKKQTLLAGTMTLIVIGFIVKVLGLVNRIVIARILGTEAMGIYMLAIPTMILLITIGQLGFPIAISKIISENSIKKKNSDKSILITSVNLSLRISLVLVVLIFFVAKFVATSLLNEPRTYYSILTFAILVPFCSLSSILKGYFNGLKIIYIPALAQLFEQIVRITTSILLVLYFTPMGIEYAVFGAILSISIGEIIAFIFLFSVLIKEKKLSYLHFKLSDIKVDKGVSSDIMSISLPATGTRLIGSLSYFFEPIIFVFAAGMIGITQYTINTYYGQIAGYVLPVLMIPSFIAVAVATPIIPIISEKFAVKDTKGIETNINLAFSISFMTGVIASIIITIYAKELLLLLFNNASSEYMLKISAPFFIIFYFQLPITSVLQAIGRAKKAMYNSLVGNIIKLLLTFILVTNVRINLLGLPIAILASVLYVTIANYIEMEKQLHLGIKLATLINAVLITIITLFVGLIIHNSITIPYGFLYEIAIIILINFFILTVTNFGNIGDYLKKVIFSNNK